jgi:hypothetical protein
VWKILLLFTLPEKCDISGEHRSCFKRATNFAQY